MEEKATICSLKMQIIIIIIVGKKPNVVIIRLEQQLCLQY